MEGTVPLLREHNYSLMTLTWVPSTGSIATKPSPNTVYDISSYEVWIYLLIASVVSSCIGWVVSWTSIVLSPISVVLLSSSFNANC